MPGAPYLTGAEVTLADVTIFPTMVFIAYMLPKFATEPEGEAAPLFGPNLTAWCVRAQLDCAVVFWEILSLFLTNQDPNPNYKI